jgi:endonuclease G
MNKGYNPSFLGSVLPIPKVKKTTDVLTLPTGEALLHYPNFSIIMSKARKLAYVTAVNIDASLWKDNLRDGTWKNDPRLSTSQQWGAALYTATKSDFEKGHLVKREDPEWGTQNESEEAGKSTFQFPNCAPQHSKLNKEIWQELENNILHTGAISEGLKVSVFTGPVLGNKDPAFITTVKGEAVQLPLLFWKVVAWKKDDGKLYAVGFLMSQEKFLLDAGVIVKPKPSKVSRSLRNQDIFQHLQFRDGKTYQINLAEIEKLAGIKFTGWSKVQKPFTATTALSATKKTVQQKNARSLRNNIKRVSVLNIKGLTL